MYSITHILLCVHLTLITAVSVKIDGMIDLGPNWNYKYTLKSYNENDDRIKSYTQLEQRSKNDERPVKLVNEDSPTVKLVDYDIPMVKLIDNYDEPKNSVIDPNKIDEPTVGSREKKIKSKSVARKKKSTGLYTEPRKIKNDRANEFLKHIYKQSITVFDSLKDKVNDYNLRRQIDGLSKNYQMKFRNFILETQGHTIRTRLGTQKVILNAIQVSSGLLNRLVSVMLGDLTKKGVLRNKVAVNIVEKEVKNVIDLEYKHACSKFKICRTDNTFSNFLTDILTTLLKNDDKTLKMAIDAFTETLKNNKFSSIMDEAMTKKFHQGVEEVEKMDISQIKPLLFIIRSILASKFKPLVITEKIDSRVNKTFALLDTIDILDKNLPGNEINTLEWNDMKNSLQDWSDGKRNDIVDISQLIIDYLIKSTNKMSSSSAEAIRNNLKYFFS